MERFRAKLVAGGRAPYSSWTFVVVPQDVVRAWGRARIDVRGTIGGAPVRGTVAKGEGVHRLPVKKELLERIGAARGDVVEVALEPDRAPPPVALPPELAALFADDSTLAERFEALPPSLRRAWASHVGEAKRAETRARRARAAPDGIRARRYPNQGT